MKGKTMKKVYLKDLQLDEVIRRLKSGEILKNEQSKSQIKYIDGVLCRICENGTIEYNTNFWTCNIAHYFEEPEELKLEVGKPYTAREIELEEKLKIAQEALEFYANKENNYYANTVWEDWENDEFATVNGDIENGYKARQALEKIKD